MQMIRDLVRYRRAIEEAVVALGRDDVGVGHVETAGLRTLSVTFVRGPHTHTAHIPIDAFEDRKKINGAITAALVGLSKRVSQEVLAKASR